MLVGLVRTAILSQHCHTCTMTTVRFQAKRCPMSSIPSSTQPRHRLCSHGRTRTGRTRVPRAGYRPRRKTTTTLATSLAATVVPCARAVCYSALTRTRLAAQHNNWLSLLGTSYYEGLDHATSIEKCTQGHSLYKKYSIMWYPYIISHICH